MLYVVHGDGGAGSCCMLYMGMVVLAHVVCSTWGWRCWMMLSVRLYVVHGDITRLRIRMPSSLTAFGYTVGSFACSICA